MRGEGGMTALLATHELKAFHGDAQALFGIDFTVAEGELVAIIGANGAGKSTFLRSLTGLMRVARESIRFKGEAIGGLPPAEIVRRGMAMVPEGRRLFASLSVEENLQMGGLSGRKGVWDLARVYRLFPILREKRCLPGTSLSGGQQQMVAVGRALMSNPELLLCDELSLGLAPIVVNEIYAALAEITAEGMTVVVVEQDVSMARKVSGRLYCFQEGRVSLEGASTAFTHEQITEAYFGIDKPAGAHS
jgi:branched-chain amino acid transport system ATP-binding protein